MGFSRPNLRRLAFWCKLVVPAALLTVIFCTVDFRGLLHSLATVNFKLAVATLFFGYLLPTVISTWRWHAILRRFYGSDISRGALLKHFWIGMFVGYLTPSGIGTDIYRVRATAARAGGFEKSAAVVVGEKVFILLGNVLLLMGAYPLVSDLMAADPRVNHAITLLYGCGLAAAAILLLVALAGPELSGRLVRPFRVKIGAAIDRLARQAGITVAGAGERRWSPVTALSPFFAWRNQGLVIAFAILGQVVASYGGRLMLLSVGVDLPLTAHLVVWTLITFIFLMPISFGTLGVREASYIVLFGLFGVGKESALAASFVGLACTLILIGIGGVIWLADTLLRGAGKRHEQ